MGGTHGLDAIDLNILQILSLYEHVNLIQPWYELGRQPDDEAC